MSIIKKFFKYYFYILSFLTPVLLLFLAYILMRVYPFGEKSVLILDLHHQYVFYYEAFYNIFHEGVSFFYSFSTSLGSGMMGIYAYYLASPFSFLLLLFPRELITEATLFMILMKVGAAGLSFAIFLKNSRKSSDISTLIFATMYALMSYVIIHTMNPMFLDGLILLPLTILGLERLVNKGKSTIFVISLSMLFVTNFYIGYMTAFFVFMYFLYYFFSKTNKFNIKTFFKKFVFFSFSSVLSVAISLWILLPTYFVLQTGKIGFTDSNFIPTQKLDFFDLFSKMLPFTYDTVNFDGLPFVFCGTIVLILSVGYFLSRQINLKSKICSALFILSVFVAFSVSTFDIVLHGFQGPNWLNYRYSFIFAFFFLLISYEFFVVLIKERKDILFKAFIIPILIITLIGRFDFPFLTTEINIWFAYVLLFIYLILLLLIRKHPKKIIFSAILLLVVFTEMFFNTYLLLKAIDAELHYSSRSPHREHLDRLHPLVDEIKSDDMGFYRMENLYRHSTNDSMALDYYGISHSTSTLNQSVIDLLFQLGYFSTSHWSKYNGGTILSDSVLGIKYVLGHNSRHDLFNSKLLNSGITHENPFAMPLVFPVDQKLKQVAFNNSNPFENQNYLLSYMLGQPYTEYFKPLDIIDIHFENLESSSNVQGYISYNHRIGADTDAYIEYILPKIDSQPLYMYIDSTYPRDASLLINDVFLETYSVASGSRYYVVCLGNDFKDSEFSLKIKPTGKDFYINNHMFYYLDMELFESAIDMLSKPSLEIEKIKETHLVVNTQAKSGEILFTSIPFDNGWRAYANGERVETFQVLNSLLAIELEEGENEIVFKFLPEGFALGLTVSLISLSLMIFLSIKQEYILEKIKYPVNKNS